jgi:acyl-coenzyme A thioesterase PaaI-like protein
MIAMMADIAGQSAARASTGNRMTTVDLILHYLSPGRFGPFTTEVQVLRSNGVSALSRVEVKDAGDDDRIIAVAMNTAALEDSTPK